MGRGEDRSAESQLDRRRPNGDQRRRDPLDDPGGAPRAGDACASASRNLPRRRPQQHDPELEALQNRVTPFGELVADPARGLVYGNRGCLHDNDGHIRRRFNGRRWIACRLEFRGWQRGPLLQPGKFTELFFLDEVTALAAGHRPCALCRYADYTRFTEIWRGLHPDQTGADAIDAQLHRERVDPHTRGQRHHEAAIDDLPDGTFVLRDGSAWLVVDARMLRWTAAGYADHSPRPKSGQAVVITPPSLVGVLRTDWQPLVPLIHPSSRSHQ
jgi:hypothetical protein